MLKRILARIRGGAREPAHLIAENDFGRYCVPRSSVHRPAARMVLDGEVYERDTIRYIREQCGDGDVVHAGMYFGDFLPGIASALAPGALLWAAEPNPESFRCAQLTAELNQLDNVRLHRAALGSSAGRVHLQVEDAGGQALGGTSHVAPGDSSGGESGAGETSAGEAATVEVDVVAIDQLVPADRQVTVIQLDLEGYESQAVLGAQATLRRCRPALVVETIPDGEAAELLDELGYQQTTRVHRNPVFTCP